MFNYIETVKNKIIEHNFEFNLVINKKIVNIDNIKINVENFCNICDEFLERNKQVFYEDIVKIQMNYEKNINLIKINNTNK